MQAKLTGWLALLNESDRNSAASPNNPPASRRLSKILDADQIDLIVINRRARAGLSNRVEEAAQAPPVSRIESAVHLGRLDRLLKRKRRGPRSAR